MAEITKEALTQRMTALQKDKQSLLDALNATGGAIQECAHWLSVIDQETGNSEKNDAV